MVALDEHNMSPNLNLVPWAQFLTDLAFYHVSEPKSGLLYYKGVKSTPIALEPMGSSVQPKLGTGSQQTHKGHRGLYRTRRRRVPTPSLFFTIPHFDTKFVLKRQISNQRGKSKPYRV